MAAVTKPFPESLFNLDNPMRSGCPDSSLLELMKELYDSEDLAPVMPYRRGHTVYDALSDFLATDKPQAAANVSLCSGSAHITQQLAKQRLPTALLTTITVFAYSLGGKSEYH